MGDPKKTKSKKDSKSDMFVQKKTTAPYTYLCIIETCLDKGKVKYHTLA